jgi:hypothetical protein
LTNINNLTWGALGGQWTPGPLVCRKCNMKMSLHPINKSQSPEYWLCDRISNLGRGCQRTITMSEIVHAFEQAELQIEHEHLCKIMAFAVDTKEIRIEVLSDDFVGTSREESKERYLTSEQKSQIGDDLCNYIEAILSIEIEDLSDLFQT